MHRRRLALWHTARRLRAAVFPLFGHAGRTRRRARRLCWSNLLFRGRGGRRWWRRRSNLFFRGRRGRRWRRSRGDLLLLGRGSRSRGTRLAGWRATRFLLVLAVVLPAPLSLATLVIIGTGSRRRRSRRRFRLRRCGRHLGGRRSRRWLDLRGWRRWSGRRLGLRRCGRRLRGRRFRLRRSRRWGRLCLGRRRWRSGRWRLGLCRCRCRWCGARRFAILALLLALLVVVGILPFGRGRRWGLRNLQRALRARVGGVRRRQRHGIKSGEAKSSDDQVSAHEPGLGCGGIRASDTGNLVDRMSRPLDPSACPARGALKPVAFPPHWALIGFLIGGLGTVPNGA